MQPVERITDPYKISFPFLNLDFTINPTAFTIFGVDIQWYGLIITFGLILAMIFCFSKMKKFGLDGDRAIDAVIGGIIGGIVGARAYFVIFQWDEYKDNLSEIFNIRNGGLAIYGGVIGAVLVGGLICKIRKVKFLPMLDITTLGFLIGQGIGRWGNFVNQEAFGTNTDCFLAMTGGTIQHDIINGMAYMDGDMYMNGLSMSENYGVHPCFLYESLWCLLGFIVLASFIKRRKFDGQLSLMYIAWYGAGRFVIEGLRTDSLMIGQLRVSQVLAGVLACSAIVLLIVTAIQYKRLGKEAFVLYVDTEESKKLLEEARKAHEKVDTKISEVTEDDANDEDYEKIISDNADEASASNDETSENSEKADTSEEKTENAITSDVNNNDVTSDSDTSTENSTPEEEKNTTED